MQHADSRGDALVQIPSGQADVDNSLRRSCHPGHVADPEENAASLELFTAPVIERRILVVRERQVMLDEDLADLYGVETKRPIEQVKRN